MKDWKYLVTLIIALGEFIVILYLILKNWEIRDKNSAPQQQCWAVIASNIQEKLKNALVFYWFRQTNTTWTHHNGWVLLPVSDPGKQKFLYQTTTSDGIEIRAEFTIAANDQIIAAVSSTDPKQKVGIRIFKTEEYQAAADWLEQQYIEYCKAHMPASTI